MIAATVTRSADGASAVLRWTRQSDLTSYELLKREKGATRWTVHGTRSAATGSATIIGLDPARAYEFMVRGREDSPLLFVAGKPAPAPSAAIWKTLILVIRECRFKLPDGRLMVGNWTRQLEYDRALSIAKGWPATVSSWSNGMAQLDAKVVEVPLLTTLTPIWEGFWAAQEDVQHLIDQHMPDADSVVTIVDMDDDPNGVSAFHWGGLGRGGIPTYACVPLADGNQFWWLDGVNDDEALIHEWLHGVEPFLKSKGFAMPDLHGATTYGFPEHMAGPNTGWEAWYRAYLTGRVPRGDGTYFGCTAAAWKSGTPR